ncbi:MAG: pyrroline-5-carboxylate reductase [Geminicoccaceae bacterium]|nr:pyrroline-5-carboxylate reductase [Geminicoccaceae bacterium]
MQRIAGPLLLAGGGKMGSALMTGWLRGGLAGGDAFVIEPNDAARDAIAALGVETVAASADTLPAMTARTIVVAVKPQVMGDVLPALTAFAGPGTQVVSIAAGKPISSFEAIFGSDTAIVRVMPNTPAAIGRGMSVLCANRMASDRQRREAEALMRAVGETAWVEDEEQMHAVTALSGSGPAYVFHLVEAMAQAGEKAGLPVELARLLALRTVEGAGALAGSSSDSPSALRVNVTSPGGTTQAALEVLMAEDGLAPLMERTVAAAATRSRELA